jgi:predicted ribonuclease YlaK
LNVEEALKIVDSALSSSSLSDVQEHVFRGVWAGQTYEKIADQTNYDAEYIKHIGYQLWQKLSRSLDEKVTKSNLQSVLRRKAAQVLEITAQSTSLDTQTQHKNRNTQSEQVKLAQRQDWGEAINIPAFYGRTAETAILQQWVLNDHCQLVTLLGMGGIGKTALARKFVESI